MEYPARATTAGGPLQYLLAHARLPLSPERAAALAPQVDSIAGLIDQLDELDLSETPIASAFDARWE